MDPAAGWGFAGGKCFWTCAFVLSSARVSSAERQNFRQIFCRIFTKLKARARPGGLHAVVIAVRVVKSREVVDGNAVSSRIAEICRSRMDIGEAMVISAGSRTLCCRAQPRKDGPGCQPSVRNQPSQRGESDRRYGLTTPGQKNRPDRC